MLKLNIRQFFDIFEIITHFLMVDSYCSNMCVSRYLRWSENVLQAGLNKALMGHGASFRCIERKKYIE